MKALSNRIMNVMKNQFYGNIVQVMAGKLKSTTNSKHCHV